MSKFPEHFCFVLCVANILPDYSVLILVCLCTHQKKPPRIATDVQPRANPRALQEWQWKRFVVVCAHISVYSKLPSFDYLVLMLVLIFRPTHGQSLNSGCGDNLAAKVTVNPLDQRMTENQARNGICPNVSKLLNTHTQTTLTSASSETALRTYGKSRVWWSYLRTTHGTHVAQR